MVRESPFRPGIDQRSRRYRLKIRQADDSPPRTSRGPRRDPAILRHVGHAKLDVLHEGTSSARRWPTKISPPSAGVRPKTSWQARSGSGSNQPANPEDFTSANAERDVTLRGARQDNRRTSNAVSLEGAARSGRMLRQVAAKPHQIGVCEIPGARGWRQSGVTQHGDAIRQSRGSRPAGEM